MPENIDIWELWLAVNTQWRATGFSIVGLDYPAVYQTAQLIGVDLSPAEFSKLQALERAVLKEVNEEASNHGK